MAMVVGLTVVFILNPKVIDLIENDFINWEEQPLLDLLKKITYMLTDIKVSGIQWIL